MRYSDWIEEAETELDVFNSERRRRAGPMPETVTEQLSRAVIRLLATGGHMCGKPTGDGDLPLSPLDCPRCQAEEQAERALLRERGAKDHEPS